MHSGLILSSPKMKKKKNREKIGSKAKINWKGALNFKLSAQCNGNKQTL